MNKKLDCIFYSIKKFRISQACQIIIATLGKVGYNDNTITIIERCRFERKL